ncbi:conserved hypothetical protein [Alteracholeplasma palmae J233]|uniref:Uncharacterized protein n=1 Tax=Alteracholeplasma palmae (strain ATCC 49389 / J233) TaxID=1318466 RepID=U4KKN7_ALTPJ|nr:Wadjet anti-phage system protein JetA family protein [Alteracholeplasma palmae]CCV64188.1 conserved hypothetical protein [Alteracholeplasma palmae J233]
MAHLFDTIPDTFFSVLSSPNKHIYVDCLFIIFDSIDTMEDAFQGDREFIIHKLQDYFEDKKEAFIVEGEQEIQTTSRQKSVSVINVFKKTGWLGEEELGDYRVSLNLFDYSIRIIEVLKSIKNNEQIEYTGEIYSVYSILKSFTIDEGHAILEQAYLKTNDILRRLKTLKANIYRFYHDITKNQEKNNLQRLLEKLLVDYKQNFFDSAYYNLKTKDSLPRYKRSILESLSKIYENDEHMEKLTESMMIISKQEDYNLAYLKVEARIRTIRDSFEGLDQLINEIDRKNEQYINAAASKILFLTNHSDDLEGILNRLFKIIIEDNNKIDYTQFFNLVSIRNLDDASMFNPRRQRVEAVAEEIFYDEDYITEELKREKIQNLTKHNIYSKVEINKYVLSLLQTDDSLEAIEAPLQTQQDFIRLILVFLYSKSIGVSYDIKLLTNNVTVNDITFQNFVIFKKGVSL